MQMLEITQFHFCPNCGKAALRAQGSKACQCAECGFLYYHNPVPSVVAIIEDGEQILLTTRVNEPHQGGLALPGGFIDYEENLEEALAREMREELNLSVSGCAYLCSHWDQYVYLGNHYNTLVAYFVVQVEDIHQASPNDDVSSFELVRPESVELDGLAFEADRAALREYARFREKRSELEHQKTLARKSAFSKKAEKYARYRWDYAPEAVQAIYERCGVGAHSALADLGAGTGILTRHFAGRLGRVYAVEPNAEMRIECEKLLGSLPGCRVLNASAEATGLPDASVDLVTIAQAVHWFEPEAARREIGRILKPGGWLALLRNYSTDAALDLAVQQISTPENGVRPPIYPPLHTPAAHYYGSGVMETLVFPFEVREDWATFFGAQLSVSHNPDEDSPGYANFEQAARQVFERFCQGDQITLHGVTELILGRPQFEPANL